MLDIYIAKEMQKRQVATTKGLKAFFKTIWQLRSLLVSCVAHFFDTATDIALVIEWYNLYQLQSNAQLEQDNIYNNNNSNMDNVGELPNYLRSSNINMKTMFICGLLVLIYYRLTSAYTVYKLSHSKMDSILQFIFDFYLIKAIYINIYKMKSYEPLSFVKIIRGFEGDTESAFQAILSLLYLIQINETQGIAVLSFITSLYSLISRYIYADRSYIKLDAHGSKIEFEDLWPIWKIFGKISKSWLKHIIFRILDVSTNVIMVSLAWYLLDGVILCVFFGIIIIFIQFFALLLRQNLEFTFISFFVRMPFRGIWFERTPCGLVYFEKYIFGTIRIILSFIMLGKLIEHGFNDDYYPRFVTVAVCGILINSLVVLPVYFSIFIWPIYVAQCDRKFHSYGFSDVNGAIQVSDIDFLLFSKLMGVNPFHNDKSYVSRYITTLCSNYWFMGTATSMVISLARQPKFDHQIYQFLKEWYNELHNISDNNDNSNNDNGTTGNINNGELQLESKKSGIKKWKKMKNVLTFEEFLACQVMTTDEVVASMTYTSTARSNNIEIWKILHKTGKVDWNKLKYRIGCDCKYTWWYYASMLHWIVFRSSVNIVEWYLLNSGCDVNVTSKTGTTAMHLLMKRVNRRGWTDDERNIGELLVKYGIDLKKCDRDGKTAKDCLREKYKEEYDLLFVRGVP